MLTHRNLLFSAKTSATLRKHDAARRALLRAADLAYRRHLAADDDADGRRVTSAGQPSTDPAGLAKALAEDGITMLYGVPATYQRLLEYKTDGGPAETGARRAAADVRRGRAARSRTEGARGEGIRTSPAQRATASPNARPGFPAFGRKHRARDSSVGTLIPGIEARDRRARRRRRRQTARSASCMSADPT